MRAGWWCTVVGALVVASPAMAATEIVTTDLFRGESPRSGELEIKLGSYAPLIDEEPGLTGSPFRDMFGGSMLLGAIDAYRLVYQGYGAAGVGVSVGYGEKFGRALITSTLGDTNEQSSESTSIRVIPLKLLGTYRLDYAALHWNIPLVPYVKAGFVAEPFWFSKGGATDLQGVRFGFEATGGLALMLDFFEPRLAKDFDTDMGVNHTFLFAEYEYDNVNNFGGSGLNLSSRTWMFGLALEY